MFTTRLSAFFMGAFLVCASAQAQLLTFAPSSQSLNSGDAFSVDLRISGLGDGTSLSVGVFDIDVFFDALLLSFDDATYGAGLDVLGLGSLQITTPGGGAVNLFELSFDTAAELNALQPAAFTLATLHFTALTAGTSALDLAVNAMGDADGADLPVSVQNGSVIIAPPSTIVPEPQSLALLLAGLTLLGVVRRRA